MPSRTNPENPNNTPPEGGLGTSRFVSPPAISKGVKKRHEARAYRYELREALRDSQTSTRVAQCALYARTRAGVSLRLKEHEGKRVAGYSGLQACGSVWCCPACASRIASQRQGELATVVERAHMDGYTIGLFTLTVRHHKGHSLEGLWGHALGAGWKAITQGKQFYKKFSAMSGLGYVKSTEITHGSNGWHPHLHVVIVAQCSEQEMRDFGEWAGERWIKGLQGAGYSATATHGYDMQVVTPSDDIQGGAIGSYLAKQGSVSLPSSVPAPIKGLAAEATQGMNKVGRMKNRTPFAIAHDLIQNGEEKDSLLWEEYVAASKGKRQLTWSRNGLHTVNLREFFCIEEKSDDDIVSESLGSEADDVLVIGAHDWKKVRLEAHELLNVAESHGADAAKAWLTVRGVTWYEPDDPVVLALRAEVEAERQAERNGHVVTA